MASVGELLASYLPQQVVNKCTERVRGQAWEPSVDAFVGCTVFCDISGFTALTERLAEEGNDGAEKLVGFLNDYFGRLVATVHDHNGDVMIFAGDALLAVWRCEPGEDLAVTTLRAVQCAHDIELKMNCREDADQPLLHMGVGSGPMNLFQVGGEMDQWVCVATGSPFLQLSSAVSAASPDRTVLSPEAWELVGHACEGESVDGDDTGLVRLVSIRPDARVERVSLAAMEAFDARATVSLRMFIPRVVQRSTIKDQKTWVAELRRISVMFININDLDMSDASCLDRLHDVVQTLQRAIYKYGGAINKMLLDDKGFVVLVGFGLPPDAHVNDQERCVLAAKLAKKMLNEIEVTCAIGVTTGTAFCGVVGSERRREYTMIGDVVNTAARLMTNTHDSITIDRPTVEAAMFANRLLSFEQLPSKKFKGKKEEMEIFAPKYTLLKPSQVKSPDEASASNVRLVGRSREMQVAAAALTRLKQDRSGGLIIVEGELGVGKTRLIEEINSLAVDMGLCVLTGCGDAVERGTPFFPWRGPFMELFGLTNLETAGANGVVVRRLLTTDHTQRYAALLNPVLCLNYPENEHTEGLNAKQRLDRTVEILFSFLTEKADEARPLVILLEDIHKFDKSGRRLAVLIASVPNILVVVSTRANHTHVPGWYGELLSAANMELLSLRPLDPGTILRMVRNRLGVSSLPAAVRSIVVNACAGNPFFAQEVAKALLEQDIIRVEGSSCRLADGADPNRFALPHTLMSIVTARMDGLSVSQSQTIKAASVVGAVFDLAVVFLLVPCPPGMDRDTVLEGIKRDVDELVDAGLITKNRAAIKAGLSYIEGETSPLAKATRHLFGDLDVSDKELYAFTNPLTHQMTYNLMLYTHRTELHTVIAANYEMTFFDKAHAIAALIAHHYERGNVFAKAMYFYEVAADVAANDRASDTAVELLRKALSLDLTGVARVTLVRLHRKLGEALYDLGDEDGAREELLEALAIAQADEVVIVEPPAEDTMLYSLLWRVTEAESELGSVSAAPVLSSITTKERRLSNVRPSRGSGLSLRKKSGGFGTVLEEVAEEGGAAPADTKRSSARSPGALSSALAGIGAGSANAVLGRPVSPTTGKSPRSPTQDSSGSERGVSVTAGGRRTATSRLEKPRPLNSSTSSPELIPPKKKELPSRANSANELAEGSVGTPPSPSSPLSDGTPKKRGRSSSVSARTSALSVGVNDYELFGA